MSEIRVTNVIGENGNSPVNFTKGINMSGICTATAFIPSQGQLSHRNLFVNGACRINQRGTVTVGSGYGGPDRWVQYKSGSGAAITSQDTDVPTGQGFRNSIKLDVSTALASGSSNWAWIGQYIEAQDCQSICKGTSNAKQLTLQFWVKSPKTGTHTVRLDSNDSNDGVGATYTVSSANTWEKKIVTFPASTSGTINDDTGRGIHVLWVLSARTNMSSGTLNTTWAAWVNANAAPGQPNILDSTSNNFYLTGVQLEVGSVATPFEHHSYADELRRCQRYYQRQAASSDAYIQPGKGQGTTAIDAGYALAAPLRAEPTVACASNRVFKHNGYSNSTTAPSVINWSATNSPYSSVIALRFSGHSSITSNYVCAWCPTFGSVLTLDAEL